MMPASHYVSIMSCMSRGIFLKPLVHFFLNRRTCILCQEKVRRERWRLKIFSSHLMITLLLFFASNNTTEYITLFSVSLYPFSFWRDQEFHRSSINFWKWHANLLKRVDPRRPPARRQTHLTHATAIRTALPPRQHLEVLAWWTRTALRLLIVLARTRKVAVGRIIRWRNKEALEKL